TFRHDPHVQAFAHTDHSADNARIVLLVSYIADKGSIDLQGVDRKALQVSQTRITGAEVIERELYTNVFESCKHYRRGFRILHKEGLCQLEFQIAWIQPRLCQDSAHAGDKILR